MRYRRILGASAILPLALALAVPGGAAPGPDPEVRQGASFFLTEASTAPAQDIALDYLRGNAADFGVSAADLTDLVVLSQSTSEASGVRHVNVVQQLDGLQVVETHATVNVTKDGQVLHVSAALSPGLDTVRAAAAAAVTPEEAVIAAAETLDIAGAQDATAGPSARSVEQNTVVETQAAAEPVQARKVWQPTPDGLRLAWDVVIDEADEHQLWNATVDAITGETLETTSWTDDHDAQELSNRLTRNPAQFETAGTGIATTATAAASATEAGAVLGGSPRPIYDGSSYRVFDSPQESPNDGRRTLVTDPADSVASPFGWHDTDGVAGPEHTDTQGNNVHAYTDQDNDGVPDPGSSPDGGPGLDFDFEMDLTEHAQDYREGAVTNLFYWNNVIHDVMFNFGFDEESGNFQVTNYSGEGVGGDDVRGEAADGGGANNANFSTPANDGGRPRMQMYLWPGAQFGLPSAVTLGSGEDAVSYGANYARFTPPATNAGTDGEVQVIDDACADVEADGAVALVDRDGATCTVHTQVRNAEAGGAVAVVVIAGETAPILNGTMDPAVGIPAVSVSDEDGAAMTAAATDGAPVSVHKASSHPGIRDGDLDNGVIIHEYGHGVSNRLTGGPDINCLSGQEQMGEGWSDYLAITMLIDPELDDPETGRGMGTYVLYQNDRSGAGIRPRPYTRDMAVQPFTYDRIRTGGWLDGSTLAAPHGVGHTWAATLWDLNWDLIDKHGFDEDLYGDWDTAGNTRAMQYVMEGMKMQGCFPGFVAGRDGILAAAEALGGEDTCTIWSAFARRGLGASAVQGTSALRDDNTEAFDIPVECGAPGEGLVGKKYENPPTMNTANAGSALPVQFSLDGNRGKDVLRDAHSPAHQEVDCTTGEPLRYATTQPTQTTGKRPLTYNARQDRYQYNWKTDYAWAGTCQELQIILDDGTQHRALFAFE